MHLKEQFVNGLNDDVMMAEIIRVLMAINYNRSVISGPILK